MTVPVQRGRADYQAGVPVTANPYNAGSMYSIHWHIAWLLCRAFSHHKPLDS